jgi:pSer/pThr/pTyr-binding forkhead associated (FHA) protein
VVPPFVLTVLKVVFLALLYFFIYRAFRSVVVDLRAASVPVPRAARPAPARPHRPRPRGKAPRLLVVLDERGHRVESVRLDGPVDIGRAEGCRLRLRDSYVSAFHARIFQRDGSWFVEDLGSTNGTYLNQRRITAPTEVRSGDRLKLGKTSLELRR